MNNNKSDVSGLANNVPIVALTANAMSSAKQMFLNEGFDGFVSKPIEIEELERVLKQVLPKSSLSYEYEDENGITYISDKEETNDKEVIIEEEEEPFKKLTLKERLEGNKIDVDAGLSYCLGDEEFYTTLLLQFAKEADEKIPDLTRFYNEKDWGNYEIIVHALKSTAKMVGAMPLSNDALELEKAAKEKRENYILENHTRVMSELELLKENIYFAVADTSDKEEEEEEEILEFKPEEASEESSDEVLEFKPVNE